MFRTALTSEFNVIGQDAFSTRILQTDILSILVVHMLEIVIDLLNSFEVVAK